MSDPRSDVWNNTLIRLAMVLVVLLGMLGVVIIFSRDNGDKIIGVGVIVTATTSLVGILRGQLTANAVTEVKAAIQNGLTSSTDQALKEAKDARLVAARSEMKAATADESAIKAANVAKVASDLAVQVARTAVDVAKHATIKQELAAGQIIEKLQDVEKNMQKSYLQLNGRMAEMLAMKHAEGKAEGRAEQKAEQDKSRR